MNRTRPGAVETRPVSPSHAPVTAELDVTGADDGDDDGAEADDAVLPERVGRYVVLDRIGEGGMGVVVSAYDGELDRVVALKLLHPGSRALNAHARLVREAHALARLSHPHVVEVYDAGTILGRTFIAMQWVRGSTLEVWLRVAPRGWREVLAMFLGAGAGLAAAHDAGIAHRDFKPENVLVGEDGRARVVDFGLARGQDDGGERTTSPSPEPPTGAVLHDRLTGAGLVVGTPAYMAPEQRRGGSGDARSDQYSFCLALHDALFGRRAGDGRVERPARAHGAPTAIARVLRRGLARSPEARWPSMDALLEALSRCGRRRARVGRVAIGTAIGTALVAVLGWRSVSGEPSPGCAGEQARVHAIWEDAARERVRRGLLDTGLGYAGSTWSRIEAELDAYAERAASLGAAACATETREREATLACLEHRTAAFQAVVDVLAQADAATLERAGSIVAGLPDLAVCDDPDALADALPLPTAPDDRERARAIREGLSTVDALRGAKRFQGGIVLARDLLAEAEALAYPPVVAEARLALGSLLELAGDDHGAERELVEAAMIARIEGRDRVATIAMTRLAGTVGYRLARVDEGRSWARHAASMLDRARMDVAGRAQLLNNLGAVEFRAGEYARAESIYRDAVALLDPDGTPGAVDTAAAQQERASAHANLGNVLARQGRFQAAQVELGQAAAILEALLGPEHPTVAVALINLGNVSYDLGHYDAAAAYHRRAYAVVQACFDDGSIAGAALGGAALGNLGLVLHRQGDDDEARRLLEESIALRTRASGPDHPDLAFAMNNLGEVYRALGRGDEALRLHDAAAAIWSRSDAAHPNAAYPLANRGLDLLELGRIDEAIVALREALEIGAVRQADSSILAAANFGLARALVLAGRDREEALALAHAAAGTYAELGGRYGLERRDIVAWLATAE